MVFLFDDLLEGATISEILFFIGSSILGDAAAVTSAETITAFISDLLGTEGTQAITDIIAMIKGETLPINVIEIDELGGTVLKSVQDEGIFLWEEEPELAEKVTQNEFLNKFTILGNQLAKNGVNMASKNGIDLLKQIVKTTIQLTTKGVKTALDPKIVVPSLIGGIGANKLFQKFGVIASKENKRRIDMLRDIVKKVQKEKQEENEADQQISLGDLN